MRDLIQLVQRVDPRESQFRFSLCLTTDSWHNHEVIQGIFSWTWDQTSALWTNLSSNYHIKYSPVVTDNLDHFLSCIISDPFRRNHAPLMLNVPFWFLEDLCSPRSANLWRWITCTNNQCLSFRSIHRTSKEIYSYECVMNATLHDVIPKFRSMFSVLSFCDEIRRRLVQTDGVSLERALWGPTVSVVYSHDGMLYRLTVLACSRLLIRCRSIKTLLTWVIISTGEMNLCIFRLTNVQMS